MTMAEWYKEHLEDRFIEADGRGGAYLDRVWWSRYLFSVVLTDDDLNTVDSQLLKTWPQMSSAEKSKNGQEVFKSIFHGSRDIMAAVNYFLNNVSYSKEDREQILSDWKREHPGPSTLLGEF